MIPCRRAYFSHPFAATLAMMVISSSAFAGNWPAWRGPTGDGITLETNLPIHWSATQNVRWKTALPARGNSTPVVWGERVFVTQAVGDKRTLICFNRKDGKLLWQQGVTSKEKELTHATNPYCSASPVTDGERVIVSFASDGLYCYDFSGREMWSRTDLGPQSHIWGGAVSPMIYQETCVLNFWPGANTYLLAVNKRTGATLWKNIEETGFGMND